MRTVGVFVLTLLCLFSISVKASAQTSWTAWLYDSANGQMFEITDTGTVQQELLLPRPLGYATFSPHIAVSPDATRFAYTARNESNQRQLLIYDVNLGAVSAIYNPESISIDSLAFSGSPSMFNQDGSQFAYGYHIHDTSKGIVRWEVAAIDTASGEAAILSADAPELTNFTTYNFGQTPVIRNFRGALISFTIVQPDASNAAINGLTWNSSDNSIIYVPIYRSIDTDTFPVNGESLSALFDLNFPSQIDPRLGVEASNVLQAGENTAVSTFYTDGEVGLQSPRFIQNGELVLFRTYTLNPNLLSSEWRVIGRDGALIGSMPRGFEADSVYGTSNGFLYTVDSGDENGSTTLYAVNTREGVDAGRRVWMSSAGTKVNIAWVEIPPQPDAIPYLPWANLPPMISPMPTANPMGSIVIGGGVVVTVAGNNLRLRNGAGTGFDVLGTMSQGTFLNVLEGPVEADGYIWWRVRTPDGLEGWAVEFSGSDRWLDAAPAGGGSSASLGG
jgi:hypothetical protein